MRCRSIVALLLFAALGVAACGSEAPAAESSLEQVRDMLRQRSQALTHGDVDGYLRPMTAAARAFEEPIARGTRSVPIAQFDLVFNPPADVSADAPAFTDVPVTATYRYTGLPDDNRFTIELLCSFARQDGSWLVTKSAPASPPGGNDTGHGVPANGGPSENLPPWATGAVVVSRTAHFLALSRPGLPHLAESLALAEQARARLIGRLTLVPDPVWLLLLARDAPEADGMGPQAFPRGALAYASYSFIDAGLPAERSMTVDLEFLFGRGTGAQPTVHGLGVAPVEVFQHEMGHLALTRYDSPNTVSWVREGAAMYLSGERRFAQWKEGLRDNLFAQVSFADLTSVAGLPGAVYPYANAAVDYLVEAHGPAQFFTFYRGFKDLAGREGRTGSAPSESDASILLQRIYGITDRQLDTLTLDWMRRQVASGH